MTLLVLVHTHVPVENYHELKLLSVLQVKNFLLNVLDYRSAAGS